MSHPYITANPGMYLCRQEAAERIMQVAGISAGSARRALAKADSEVTYQGRGYSVTALGDGCYTIGDGPGVTTR